MDGNIPQYPYMFSPDQFANKFSNFQGKALPWPSQYMGTPTDALGRPIQSYLDTQAAHDAWNAANPAPSAMPPSTTLNSRPGAASDPQLSQIAQNFGGGTVQDWLNARGAQQGGGFDPNTLSGTGRTGGVGYYAMTNNQGGYGRGMPYQPQAQAARPAAAQNPYDMNQAYLNALANPGHVTTPGATVPQSPTPTGQSGVLNQFLANWKPSANPAGNYNPNLFPNALKGQV